MAIFTAEEYGDVIERCLLDGKDVTRLATRADIPGPNHTDIPPPSGVVMKVTDGSRANIVYCRNENGIAGILTGSGSVDLLDTDDEGHFFAGPDGMPPTTRYYGKVRLIWGVTNAQR